MKGDCYDLNKINKKLQEHHNHSITKSQSQKIKEIQKESHKIADNKYDVPFQVEIHKNDHNNKKSNSDFDPNNQIENMKDANNDILQKFDTGAGYSKVDINKYVTNNFPIKTENNIQIEISQCNVDKLINLNENQGEVTRRFTINDMNNLSQNQGKDNTYFDQRIECNLYDNGKNPIKTNDVDLDQYLNNNSKFNIITGTISNSKNEFNVHLPIAFNNEFKSTVKILNEGTPIDLIVFNNCKENYQFQNTINLNNSKKKNDTALANNEISKTNMPLKSIEASKVDKSQNTCVIQEIDHDFPPYSVARYNKLEVPVLFKIATHNFYTHYPSNNSFDSNQVDYNFYSLNDAIEKRHITQLNSNKKIECIEPKTVKYEEKNKIFSYFQSGENNRRIMSNVDLEIIKEKMKLNNNLFNDKKLEQELGIESKAERNNTSQIFCDTFNSNLNSEEGDEFFELFNIDNKSKQENFKKKIIDNKKRNLLKNTIKLKKKHVTYTRRKSYTPNISMDERNNLFNIINTKLMEYIPTPQLNDANKEILEISDRSIIKYLANNHFFDDSQGQIYNPTFLCNYINKNPNDTNNKILLHVNSSKNIMGNNDSNIQTYSKNIFKKLSLKDIRNILKKNKSITLNKEINKDIVESNNQEKNADNSNILNISHKNFLYQNSIDNEILKNEIPFKNVSINYAKEKTHFQNEKLDSIRDKNSNRDLNNCSKKIQKRKNKKIARGQLIQKSKEEHYFDVRNPSYFNSTRPIKNIKAEIFEVKNNKIKEELNIGLSSNRDKNKVNTKNGENYFERLNTKENNKSKKLERIITAPDQNNLQVFKNRENKSTNFLDRNKRLNLNEAIEQLDYIVKENEKNKKNRLINLIDFNNHDNNEAIHPNIEYNIMNLGILIEGDSISNCLDDDLKDLFWNIVKNSKSVVCCRCSPKQKAEVVGFVKKMSNKVTLAIGDGGNDIPMIKIANIGIGLFGKEGYQAAFNADYAISQFKYLKRLIFIHGRNSLLRNSYFYYFFFFKNVLLTLSQLWFCFFSGFSGGVRKIYLILYLIN